jgi:hypothetical protein
MVPQFEAFCLEKGLYLDKKGARGEARAGKKVTWEDKYGNSHDLDFVIEKGGSADVRGRPLAFIEAAWRRYTKHSRNKAQEIQGAVLPIAEKHQWDKPFLGVILAGVFTQGSLDQMKSSGFEVALFPYDTIVAAFASVGIQAGFDEVTPDEDFERTVRLIEGLGAEERGMLKAHLVSANKKVLDDFFAAFSAALDRQISQIIVIPLHGNEAEFNGVDEALDFVNAYAEAVPSTGDFHRYEIIVRYSNEDKLEASFKSKQNVVDFLRYVQGGFA